MATRTPLLVGMPVMSGHLDANYANSSRPALAHWLRTIAGHNRAYFEMLKGSGSTATAPIDGQVPCVYPNSRGIYGEDHSGAATGYGRALRHAIWTKAFPPTLATGGPDPTLPGSGMVPPTVKIAAATTSELAGLDRGYIVQVPSCYSGGAYESAKCTIMHYCSSASASSAFYVRIWSPANGPRDDENDNSVLFTFDGTSTGYEYQTETIRLIPGELNRIELRYSGDNGGVATLTGQLVCITIYNDSND